jgi:hypothetical protein
MRIGKYDYPVLAMGIAAGIGAALAIIGVVLAVR